LLAPTDPIVLADPSWDVDFEAEVCLVLGDTPRATAAQAAEGHVLLVTLVNDITLRGLVAAELAKGFGFFLSKPASAFAPVAVTPDELGPAWRGGRAYVVVRCTFNGKVVGEIDAGREMHFSFYELIEHITRTRGYVAGTLLGGGTVSCSDARCGTACLVERRALEVLELGKASTRYMTAGDTIVIEAFDGAGRSVFGRIEQTVVAA
jgi:fumarylacetoacetate (FAA) hydrolase